MANTKIFLATKNKGKIKEMKAILSEFENIEVLSMLDGIDTPDVIEDGNTFEENSIKKAVEIAKYIHMIVIADDSGIVVEALNGAPGIYSARYSGENATDESNNTKLLEELKNKDNKRAKYVAVITIAAPSGETLSFEGDVCGEIIDEYRGTHGFGYDPLFYVAKYDQTFGELDPKIKNEISHRGKALLKLKCEIKDFVLRNGNI